MVDDAPPRPSSDRVRASSAGPSVDSEITWLVHRAAHRLRSVTGERAEEHGLQLRDYIILSALHLTPNLTQVEVGKTLGLDKTTLMSQLDRLEQRHLVVRRNDPRDRRARIPEITEAGEAVRAEVAADCAEVEEVVLSNFTQDQVRLFRRMLFEIIGETSDRGSCL